MASADYLLAFSVSAVLLAVVGVLKRWKATSRLPFPPGPRPRFLVGNLFDIPTEMPWITYTEWGKQYGNIIHVQVFGQHILILNSIKAATELLEKRATIYSDRPSTPIVSLTGWDFSFSLIPYSDKWRERRRLFHQHFRRDAIPAYRPVYLRKIQDLLRGLLSTPVDFATHIKTLSAAIILDTMYGHDIKTIDDRFVHLTEEAGKRLTESMLPGCNFHKFAQDTRDLVDKMKNAPFDFVKQNMRNGSGRPSVLRELLERNDTHRSSREQEEVMKDVAGIAYAAAVDTVRINAHQPMFREVFRWRPILPFAIPHATTDDDIYEGYYIPKGTTVLPNIWAMAHDESMYPNPDRFDPERFLNADGQLNADDQILGFGFGRRVCVGRYAADATVWATIVSVLSTFDIAKTKDETGKEIEIEPVFADGVVSHPKPFQCSITPRNNIIRQLITNMTDL
ncbi:hypothetical protein MSAN_01794100 [Mycena sanguinolenta]|uniref:Cytochrome P450 n=1 Tax=Mycena sanguinolenta TaxID=230812 RepID=A0A8H7CUF6_9AGAR|nr:hypothetical protein MSAN_01794100 [Mycena sanguinolenta]